MKGDLKMKKFLYVLLVGVLLVGLIACTPAADEPETPDEPVVETPEEPAVEKTLINFAVQADSTPALEIGRASCRERV